MKPNILAIIPARGGSKGIAGKNTRLLCGKPLIAYTIEAALGSKLVDRVVVSTEDAKITEVSKRHRVEVIKRPKQLARDDSPTIDAIMHVINWFEERNQYFDIIVLLEATSPLRKENDLDNAIACLIQNIDEADSLVGVGEVHSDTEHPYGIKKIEDGYVKPFIKDNEILFYQRQQLPKVYSVYGGIYISKVSALKEHKTFYQQRTIPYFLERWQNYEIDDIYDFVCVEAILKYRLGNHKE